MSKFRIINLIDKVFISVSIFLLIYAWINFFIRNLWITFILSLIFSSASAFILFHILEKRKCKKSANLKHLKDVDQNFLAFRVLSQTDKLNLLSNIISKQHKCEILNDSLLFSKDGLKHQVLIETNKPKLSQFEFENLLQNLKTDVDILIVFCCEYEANLNTKILKNLKIEMINKTKLYSDYFLKYNTYPDCSNLQFEKEKIKLKQIAKNFFIPSKAKSYFLCGLILIFSSIILPFHTYYLIFGSILLIFSIICKLQPIFIC